MERVDLGEVPYAQAIEAMRGWVEQRRNGEIGDRLVLLGHPPVVTYGSRTPRDELPPADCPIPLVEVDRGGQATYHGPGQLVGYLVLNLRDRGHGRGPVDIVRWLEHGLIDALSTLGFDAIRRDTPRGAQSLVGVWTPDHRKLASIGMRIRHGVTSHGFALNIDPDLGAFTRFIPCGLPDTEMTSLARIAATEGRQVPAEADVRNAVAKALGAT